AASASVRAAASDAAVHASEAHSAAAESLPAAPRRRGGRCVRTRHPLDTNGRLATYDIRGTTNLSAARTVEHTVEVLAVPHPRQSPVPTVAYVGTHRPRRRAAVTAGTRTRVSRRAGPPPGVGPRPGATPSGPCFGKIDGTLRRTTHDARE